MPKMSSHAARFQRVLKSQGHCLCNNAFCLKKVKPKRKLGPTTSSFSSVLRQCSSAAQHTETMPLPTQNQGDCPYTHTAGSREPQMQLSGLTSKPRALGKAGHFPIWLQIFLTPPVCFMILLSNWSLAPLRNIPSASLAWLRLMLCTRSLNL